MVRSRAHVCITYNLCRYLITKIFPGQALIELSKDKSSLKMSEQQTHQFLKTLNLVETKLTEQINYLTQVSTGQPHEGSGYASQKVLQMAWHRLEHARSRVNELERNKNKQLQGKLPRVTAQVAPSAVSGATSSAPPTWIASSQKQHWISTYLL